MMNKFLITSDSSFFPELVIISHSRFERLHLFFSGVWSFLHYLAAKLHLNYCKASPCVLNFSFFLSSFYYRSSPWRLNMVAHQGFLSFFIHSSIFLSKLWFVKLYSKLNMVFNTCLVLRSSSILHLAFRSAILSILSFQVVLCLSCQFPFVFHDSQVIRNDIL